MLKGIDFFFFFFSIIFLRKVKIYICIMYR